MDKITWTREKYPKFSWEKRFPNTYWKGVIGGTNYAVLKAKKSFYAFISYPARSGDEYIRADGSVKTDGRVYFRTARNAKRACEKHAPYRLN